MTVKSTYYELVLQIKQSNYF